MFRFQWILSPEADVFWYWARNINGLIVAVTVFGESFHHVPAKWLPLVLQSNKVHDGVSKRAWIICVVALLFEVPIEMARDAITNKVLAVIGERVEYLDPNLSGRHVSKSQKEGLKTVLHGTRKFVHIVCENSRDIEVSGYSNELASALAEAGAELNMNLENLYPTPFGLTVEDAVEEEYSKIAEALHVARIEFKYSATRTPDARIHVGRQKQH